MELYNYRQLQRTNTPSGKTVTVGQTKLPLSWTSVNNKLISSMAFYSTSDFLQGGCLYNWLLNWRKDMWTPARNFCINKRRKNWLKVNAVSTTSCLKQTRQEKNSAFPPHQNPKNSVFMHLWENWCWHCSRINEAKLRSTTVTSASHCDLLNNYLRSAIRLKLHRLQSSNVFIFI
jgi:hypothetical protein